MWPYELNIDCEKYTAVYEHISKNIHEINSFLWDEENLPVPTEKWRKKLYYLDENEFEKFIEQLLKLN